MIDLLTLLTLLTLNHTNSEHVIPFPVAPGGVTFCFNQFKKVDGVKQPYIECNYVQMPKKKLTHLRDFLENWTSQK